MEIINIYKCQHCDCNACPKNINRNAIWDSAAGACDGCSYCESMPTGECIIRKTVDVPKGRG